MSDEILRTHNIKLTPTYLISQAVSLIFAARPQLNVILRFSRLYQRDIVSFSFLVAVTSDEKTKKFNLSNCVVHDVTKLSLMDFYKSLSGKINKTKKNEGENIQKQDRIMKKIPSFLMEAFLNFTSLLMYTLNIRLKGIPYDPFGSVMISNLGQIDVDTAFIPLVPYSKVPILVAIGLVKPRPVVNEQREVVVRDMLRLNFTIDHRYIEGKSLSIMQKMFFYIFEDPKRWLLPSAESVKGEFTTAFYESLKMNK